VRKTKEEAEITKQKIIDAALDIFKRRGYVATRLEDIADETGMTRGAIYWHFKTKMELFETLLGSVEKKFDSLLAEFRTTEGSALDKLRLSIVKAIRTSESDERLRDIWFAVGSQISQPEEMEKLFQKGPELARKYIDYITGLIEEGINEGSIFENTDPVDAAWAIVCFIKGVTFIYLHQPKIYPFMTKTETLVDYLLRGIERRPK
jgi:TetR/AcrR family acrAB operon transcriptional repressor